MLSKEMIDTLNNLAKHELINAMTYLKLSHDLANEGFKNLSSYYKVWSEEELEHHQWVFEFMDSIGISTKVGDIPNINLGLEDITHFYEVSERAELNTNELYQNALEQAYNEEDAKLSGILVKFIDSVLHEQREETAKYMDIKDATINFTGNKAMLKLFDMQFEK